MHTFFKEKKSSSSEVETLARKQLRYQRMKRNAYSGSPSQRTQQAQTGESQRGSGQGRPTAQHSPGCTGILGKARSCTVRGTQRSGFAAICMELFSILRHRTKHKLCGDCLKIKQGPKPREEKRCHPQTTGSVRLCLARGNQ